MNLSSLVFPGRPISPRHPKGLKIASPTREGSPSLSQCTASREPCCFWPHTWEETCSRGVNTRLLMTRVTYSLHPYHDPIQSLSHQGRVVVHRDHGPLFLPIPLKTDGWVSTPTSTSIDKKAPPATVPIRIPLGNILIILLNVRVRTIQVIGSNVLTTSGREWDVSCRRKGDVSCPLTRCFDRQTPTPFSKEGSSKTTIDTPSLNDLGSQCNSGLLLDVTDRLYFQDSGPSSHTTPPTGERTDGYYTLTLFVPSESDIGEGQWGQFHLCNWIVTP